MRPRVYITQPVAQSAIERLKEAAEVEFNPDSAHIPSKQELIDAVRRSDILFCLLQDRVDAEVIAANPKLRMLASMKITPSDIDVAAATARRIPVTVIPAVVTEATADIHFALLLAVAASPTHGEAAGVIEGTVTFAGPVPALPAIPIEAKHREACGARAAGHDVAHPVPDQPGP